MELEPSLSVGSAPSRLSMGLSEEEATDPEKGKIKPFSALPKLPSIEVFFPMMRNRPVPPKKIVPKFVFPPSVIPPFVWEQDSDGDVRMEDEEIKVQQIEEAEWMMRQGPNRTVQRSQSDEEPRHEFVMMKPVIDG